MTYHYLVYGLHVSSDVGVPGWRASSGVDPDVCVVTGATSDVSSQMGDTLVYTSANLGRSGGPNLTIWRHARDGSYRLSYDDGTQFVIDKDARRICCIWPSGTTNPDKAVYLRGTILGFVLRLRGIVCLHASVVADDERAMILVGAVGAGKSTTAAALTARGLRFLGDDIAPLVQSDGAIHVMPSYPWANLWPDAARVLHPQGDLPRLIPPDGRNAWFDKRYLDMGATRCEPNGLPVGGVYVLDDRVEGGAPCVQPLGPHAGLMALVSETYMNVALDERAKAHEFRTLAELVRVTPVRRVAPHTNLKRLRDLCDVLLLDWRQLTRAAA